MSLQDEIVKSPDPRLTTECAPIEIIDDEIKELAHHMLDVMYESNGCGLAAPQIGVLKQICVIDVDWEEGVKASKNPHILINPEIIVADGDEEVYQEGCLSFPGLYVDVVRPTHVVVHARNLDGKLLKYEASHNLLAVCLQHEIDHLHGVTMIDHLSGTEKLNAMRTYQEELNKA